MTFASRGDVNTWSMVRRVESSVGTLLRLPLKCIPRCAVVPILSGPLAGTKWIVGSYNHGCWIGCYERPKQRLFERLVAEGNVVFDVGAHVGFYTLLASKRVGESGRVVAFEPLERNLVYLRRHLEMNGVKNVTVICAAICDSEGKMRMVDGPARSMAHFSPSGQIEVSAHRLDELVFGERLPNPDAVKIDVEGAELLVLRGALQLLHEKRPLVFLSTHGPEVHAECCRLLGRLGYRLIPEHGGSGASCSELLGIAR